MRLNPGFGPHLYDHALALTEVNRFDEALLSVQGALRAKPDMAEAHVLLGGLLGKKRQLPEAARAYQRALELQPGLSRAHLALANVLNAQGNKAGAVQHLRDAAKGGDPAVAQAAERELRQLGP